jgi:hypothetical protein
MQRVMGAQEEERQQPNQEDGVEKMHEEEDVHDTGKSVVVC